jgi:hypothetical protein
MPARARISLGATALDMEISAPKATRLPAKSATWRMGLSARTTRALW